MSKKEKVVSTEVIKKEKVAKPKKEKVEKVEKVAKGANSGYIPRLVSFSVTAVIPTQQYGNIQPKIEVMASTIEEARAMVMPVIENLYETYAEMPLSGKPVKFLGKVTETEKRVEKTSEVVVTPAVAPVTTAEVVSTPVASETPALERSEPFKKAEKMIGLALSIDALDAIEAQIQKSVKIQADDKPALYTIVLKKREELKSK